MDQKASLIIKLTGFEFRAETRYEDEKRIVQFIIKVVGLVSVLGWRSVRSQRTFDDAELG
jgi:hypothetical protein